MNDTRPTHRAAVALALLVTVLWSSSWVLIRWGIDDEGIPPITFAGIRYGLASLVLVGWVLSKRGTRRSIGSLDRPTLVRIVVLGVVLYGLTQGAQFVAIANQPAATTSLVLSLTPLLVAGVAVAALGEVPARRQVTGAVVVVLGAWLYFSGELGATTAGMVAAVVGLGANVVASVLGRQVNRDVALPASVITAVGMAVGSAALVVVGVATEGWPTVSTRGWLIVGWLAVVNTAVAFTLWNLSLRRLSAVESAGINNTMLIQIAVLGWAFLGEPLGPAEVAGVVAVSLGVFLTQAPLGPQRPRH